MLTTAWSEGTSGDADRVKNIPIFHIWFSPKWLKTWLEFYVMFVEHLWGKTRVKMAAKSAKKSEEKLQKTKKKAYLHPEECDARQEINCGFEVL